MTAKKKIKICLTISTNNYDKFILKNEFSKFITEICSDGSSSLDKFSLKEMK